MAKASTSWKKGESGNPGGRPPGTQSFLDRAKHLIDKYKIAEIKEFIGNEEKFNELSVYDGMVMRRIVEAISENGRQSMDSLLDRLLGKPPQHITQEIDATTTEITARERREEAKKRARQILDSLKKKK